MLKKINLTLILILIGLVSFSQAIEKNGTIYIKHPNIDAVIQSVKAYTDNNMVAAAKIYSDTARFWASDIGKPIKIADAFKTWANDFNNYDSISMKAVGYPDYLNYLDQDAKVVQSWWTWHGKSKKTGVWLRIPFVEFDDFNKDGKIVFESLYGDFSKMGKD